MRAAVTVVIPTKDRRDLLVEAVASVLDQGGVQVEVLVVDDGSNDGTPAWLASGPDPRVRYLRFDPSRERAAARNAGLAEASTPFVLFLDDDDVLAPGALERLVAALERHPSAPVAAGTYATFGTFGPEEVPRRQPTARLPIRRRMFREILWGWYLLPGAGLWRTDALQALGGWEPDRNFAEDLELSLRVHPAPMALVPHVVLHYRQHGRQPDRQVEADHERQNEEVRAAFLSRLDGRHRRAAARVLEARAPFTAGLAAYGEARYGPALRHLLAGTMRAPALCVSPVLGETVLGMIAKSAGALALPDRVRAVLRRSRREDRSHRFGRQSP